MNPGPKGRLNLPLIGAIAFSAFCWLCLYAAFADYAQAGFEMLRESSLLRGMVGAVLIGLHALGLLFLFVLAGGAAAVVVRNLDHGHRRGGEVNGTSH